MEKGKATPVRASVKHFPKEPGVYVMRDSADTVIYVGKAKNLRNRVRSYFNTGKDAKTAVLVRRVAHVEYIVTQNEYEALLLENNLIKRWQPRYNINLKDGKTYPVIRITNEEYPRVFKTRNIIQDGSEYYGPYPSVHSIDTYLELVERLYPLRKCRGPVKKRENPCLYYHIGRCSAVCAGKITKEQYGEHVQGVRRLLAGETEDIREQVQTNMEQASEELRFEQAANYRDILKAIETLASDQQVIDFDPDVRDYVGFAVKESRSAFVVFQMRSGKLLGTDMYRADAYGSEEDDLEEFILQYYGAKKTVPARLLLPRPLDTEHLNRYFREQHGKEVSIEIPEEGRDASIIRMAGENANQELDKQIREQGNVPALEELTRILELPRVPLRIEGFDIAHIGGKHPVGSLVSFLNGVPDKSEYRKFHVKRLEGNIDDFQAMREVIARRYQRVLNEKLARPDMILVDGGRGQVTAATEILKALELTDIPVVGLAKREEEIYLQDRDEPVTLPEGSPPLQLLQHVRDEAHRFATKFRAGQQKKDISVSTLESIPGIGPTRSKRLLRAFGSLETVAETPPDMIAKSCGINEEKAKEVKEKLRSELGRRSGPGEASDATDATDATQSATDAADATEDGRNRPTNDAGSA